MNIRNLCIIMGYSLLSSCSQNQPPPVPPTPVNIQMVKAQKVVYYDRYEGTTVALSQVNLLPEVPGYVTAIYFKEGSHVTKGELLYDIDKRLYEANYNAADANLKVAQGNLVEAQQDADRYIYLNNTNAVAKQLYDHAMITLDNAKSSVHAAEEALKTAKTNLEYSIISAPFDGTIGFSQVKLGDYLNVGQTVLNTVSTDNPMAVDFLINEKQLAYFVDIQQGSYKSIDTLFSIILPNNTLYPFTGELSVIDRAVDPQTGSIRIRLVFPNPKYYLRAGMSCVVRVHNLDTAAQIIIPNRAVVEQMGEFFVFVAKDTIIKPHDSASQKQNAAERTPKLIALQKKVQPGETIGANVIIKKGIREGDKIVIDGVQSLHDGSKIVVGK
jgi:RND family efflux transporter MFP subunit